MVDSPRPFGGVSCGGRSAGLLVVANDELEFQREFVDVCVVGFGGGSDHQTFLL